MASTRRLTINKLRNYTTTLHCTLYYSNVSLSRNWNAGETTAITYLLASSFTILVDSLSLEYIVYTLSLLA